MGTSSFVQTSFYSGEWSQTAQGDIKDPRYKLAMAASLNTLTTVEGASKRRPGTQFCGTTRGGAAGRLIRLDFEEDAPYAMEFTDGYLRFWAGNRLATTNDQQAVASISTANPAKVATSKVHGWTGTVTVLFNDLGTNNPLLQNRPFLATVTSTTEFTLADAITGATIDGSTLGTFVSGNVVRVLEIVTTYALGSWASMRSVQAEKQAVLLNGTAPQILTVATDPGPLTDATFTLDTFNFIDGPYLDPFNGSICTYDVLLGNVTLTFSFQTYSSSVSYSKGDHVISSAVGYRSLQGANLNNTPASSPTFWTPVNGGVPVGPNGFTSADIGRHIRLFSEPPAWSSGATYAAAAVLKYNGSYWQSLQGSNIGNVPGAAATYWTPVTGINYAQWTWGRVISVSGTGLVAVASPIGNMTSASSAFNGTVSQASSASASASNTQSTFPQWIGNTAYNNGTHVFYGGNLYQTTFDISIWIANVGWPANRVVIYGGVYYRAAFGVINPTPNPPSNDPRWQNLGSQTPQNANVWLFTAGVQPTFDVYAGANFSSSHKAVQSVTIFPSNDLGYGCPDNTFNFYLRAKATAPSSASDGTLLGSISNIAQFGGAVSIVSSDQTTTWAYVWVEMSVNAPLQPGSATYTVTGYVAQIEIFAPNVSNGSVITIQLAGPPLLYQAGTVVNTWRAGVYSNSLGWPTCGTYHEGRLWLSGAVGNRIDASTSGDIFTFSPTTSAGTVTDASGISYTFDARDVNKIFWLEQDQQGIIGGTQAGEWLVQASNLNNPLTPTNIQAHRVTKIGCANIEPKRTEHTLAFVQRHRRKIMEYFADVFSGKFSAPDLSEKCRHLTKPSIAEIAYQQELAPIIWSRCDDGSWFGQTYKRETLASSQGPTFNGAHRHLLGSSRIVESICVGPSTGGNLETLMMVTDDATGVRHVEALTDLFEEGSALTSAWFLDDAVAPSSYSTSIVMGGASGITLNGLWHLNGKTVSVFAGGLDVGDWTVSNGSLGVPFAPSTSQTNALLTSSFVSGWNGSMPIVVGFTYLTQGQILRPDMQPESGTRSGPGFGKNMRIHKAAVSLVDTQKISLGTDFARLNAATLKTPGKSAALADNVLFSGVHKDVVQDDNSIDGSRLCWQQTRPFPSTIAGIGGFLQCEDE